MSDEPAGEMLRAIPKLLRANQLPPVEQLIMIFILGGTVVLVATVVGKITQNPYISGILLTFPAMLLSGTLAFHMTGSSPAFISEFLLGTLPGLAIAGTFAIVGYFSFRHMDFWLGLGLSILGWLVIASIAIAFRVQR